MGIAKPNGISEQIRAALAATSEPLTSAELHAQCSASESVTQVAATLNRMFLSGELTRTTTDAGRFCYRPNPAFKGLKGPGGREGEDEPSADDTPSDPALPSAPAPRAKRHGTRRADAPRTKKQAPTPPPAAAVNPVAAKTSAYVLFDHIAAAMRDLDDLVSDAIDRGASPEVVKCVVASSAALRRAQEAIYRGVRAA
jgi:hypothetical protein